MTELLKYLFEHFVGIIVETTWKIPKNCVSIGLSDVISPYASKVFVSCHHIYTLKREK